MSAPTSVASSVGPGSPSAASDPFLGHSVVTVSPDLRVRSQPRATADSERYVPLLPLGTQLTVIGGPVKASGYTWYAVKPLDVTLSGGHTSGWIAAGDTDGTPWVALRTASAPPPSEAGTAPACPEDRSGTPLHVATPDGTTYDLLPGASASGDVRWSLVASAVHGAAGTGWRLALDPCWRPVEIAAGVGGIAYVYLDDARVAFIDCGIEPLRLLVVGPDGIRADVAGVVRHATTPSGTMYVMTELDDPSSEVESSLALLGPDGLAQPGWPYSVSGLLSTPTFGEDGTAYLSQRGPKRSELVAIAPDGRVRPGWPYAIPGDAICDCFGLRPPRIAPDGSLYETYDSGIYRVGPDGRPRPGWPYVMPPGMRPESDARGGLGSSESSPIVSRDGRTYLPVARDHGPVAIDDVVCLRSNGSPCPGWPVSLPQGWAVNELSIDDGGAAQVHLLPWGRPAPSQDSYAFLSIRPDGVVVHRVVAGETFSGVADAYGVAEASLLATNPQVRDPSIIGVGDILTIPAA